MENKRYEPMVAATYPAAMAGLCLTSLAIISSKFCVSMGIVFLLSAASLAFITSSFFIFLYVVLVEWGESSNTQNQDKTLWWSISKWAFLIGIVLVFIGVGKSILLFCFERT
jgi:hypothetical protein